MKRTEAEKRRRSSSQVHGNLGEGRRTSERRAGYDRDHVITGNVYGGKDRHNGEVAAFHLARLLGLNRVPIAAMRKINLNTEILPVASKILSRTFYRKDNTTCFYGVCTYCRPTDGVCDDRRSLEGAIVLWLPQAFQLVKHRHPWQRSYSSAPAKYCIVDKMHAY
ncbi:unnamed protein product [Nesidiocoris tenuis]|uniref:FAM20 C-terminal domain-containing protein n=1 Tax=Nesidiocoris tenuis TaxID=355587 RepID=A0A6H5HHH7_9HEMI|nr:unnamed protein product [Nesidiocoris tenuis]